ncbi:MAG: hypothetical protein CME66_12105, partial [Halobacteriovoraceae bacterium]|nr:hypothetical protein [Halobacteriovoraceae bacterium]
MDIATIIGLVLAIAAILGSILSGGSLAAFIDVPSILVVGGGVIAAIFIKWPMDQIKLLVTIYLKSILNTATDPKGECVGKKKKNYREGGGRGRA